MHFVTEVKNLILKELILEWRSKYAFTGAVLYVVSTVFVALLSFVSLDHQQITWNALFWIIMLFAAINAVAKSFLQETRGRQQYLSMLASPNAILISKVIYNAVLMLVLTMLALGFYSVVFGFPPLDPQLFIVAIVLGSISFATVFTLISAIASKAGNGGVLMAVLSFPVIIPVIIMLTRLAKNALDGLDRSASYKEILTLITINLLSVVFSLLLFPYLYRE